MFTEEFSRVVTVGGKTASLQTQRSLWGLWFLRNRTDYVFVLIQSREEKEEVGERSTIYS